MKPIIYIIAAGALLMHLARKNKTNKQSTTDTPIGVINTQTNSGTLLNYDNGKQPPNFVAGYEDLNLVNDKLTAYLIAPTKYITPQA